MLFYGILDQKMGLREHARFKIKHKTVYIDEFEIFYHQVILLGPRLALNRKIVTVLRALR